MINTNIYRAIGVFAAIGWFISLLTPAAAWGVGEAPVSGWKILLIGWVGVLNLQFAWFANVIIIPAISLLIIPSSIKIPRIINILVVLILLFFLFQSLSWSEVNTDIGNYEIVVGKGYYIWNCVVAATAAALIVQFIDEIYLRKLFSV